MANTLDYLMLWDRQVEDHHLRHRLRRRRDRGSARMRFATRTFRWEGFRDAEDTRATSSAEC